MKNTNRYGDEISLIGSYGAWAASRVEDELPALSYRRDQWDSLEAAHQRFVKRLAIPDIGGLPEAVVNDQYRYDGLHIEELSWQLPYGALTKALLLKPEDAEGSLPGRVCCRRPQSAGYFV